MMETTLLMTEDQFCRRLKALVRGFASQKRAAQCWGISQAYLNDVLQGRRHPGPKLLQALGYVRDIGYRKEKQPKEGKA